MPLRQTPFRLPSTLQALLNSQFCARRDEALIVQKYGACCPNRTRPAAPKIEFHIWLMAHIDCSGG